MTCRETREEASSHRQVPELISLQYDAQRYLSPGTTKTGVVYGLNGNPPQAHE
jgi:hypothetical protein